jgi:aminoglycoside phosphotransferase (APT) family kinase protein
VPEWSADAIVDEELAGELIRAQFAPLPELSVSLVAEGWDYIVYLVDGSWAFRFPRRAVVVPGLQREVAVLGWLAERLPVAVPAPVYVGRPSDRFPWPFYGARFLDGVEAGDAAPSDEERVGLAAPLARALRSLHAPEVRAELGPKLPADPIRRADMAFRVPRTRQELAALPALGLWEPPAGVDELLAQAHALPASEPSAICHGDLHFRQLLVHRGELTGIIDWVDVCRSDPGVDLQLVWSFLPPRGREIFFAEYGPVAETSLLRARVMALFLNAVLARYGRDTGAVAIQAEAIASLCRATAELLV